MGKYDELHTCHNECERPACVLRRKVATLEAELAAMKARGDRLAEAGQQLLEACYQADALEELPEQIDGSLLDAMRLAIWPEIWTDEQVAALNAYQDRGDVHQFTCSGNRSDDAHKAAQEEHGGDFGQLVATRQGWVCNACDYRQFWAHDFMFDQALTECRHGSKSEKSKAPPIKHIWSHRRFMGPFSWLLGCLHQS